MHGTLGNKWWWLRRLRVKSSDGSQTLPSPYLTSLSKTTTFPFSNLPIELQKYILELALTSCIPVDPRCSTSILSAKSGRFLLGLELPSEGVFEASKYLRVLSIATYYTLPNSPPVYLKSPQQARDNVWPFSWLASNTLVSNSYSQRARYWQRVIVPFRTCWMGAQGKIHALSTVLSRMYNIVELRLDIRLHNPQAMTDYSENGYHEWRIAMEALSLLPRLEHVEFTIDVQSCHDFLLSSSMVGLERSVDFRRVTATLGDWLIERDQISFQIVHEERLGKLLSLQNLYYSLDFVYGVLIGRNQNIFDRGSIPRPDFLDSVRVRP